jgi:carbamoyl-phosphate synthase large subunit
MKKLRIILTACGCPGASTLIRMLKNNGERDIEIIGTDMDDEAVGRFFVDKFHRVPPGQSKEFIPKMLELVEKEKPDILFPESSFEVHPLALNKARFEALGTRVIVSNPKAIEKASNKYLMYEVLRKRTSIDLPRYFSAESLDEFLKVTEKLGYPERPVVFKPHIGKGSRGVRILDSKADRKRQLMEEKPTSKYMSLQEFEEIFSDGKDFPKLLVMEFLKGMEIATDSLVMEGRELLTTVKTVEQARWGVIVRGELVKRPDLVEQTREILKAIPLSYCVNLQFIRSKLIEINPRVSTFIYQSNLIAPYLAIKLALGEMNEEEIRTYTKKIDYGRRMVRYMDQMFQKGGTRIF